MNSLYGLSQEQIKLKEKAAQFTKEHIIPVAREHDKKALFPEQIFLEANKWGLLNTNIPKEYGGNGLSFLDRSIIAEEFAYGCSGIASAIMVHEASSLPIIHYGTREQREKWLTKMVQNKYGSFAMTEPHTGSDIANIKTTAKMNNNSSYIIKGTKSLVSNILNSDFYVLFAKDTNQTDMSLFLIESSNEGLEIGKTFEKMGQKASNIGQLDLNNAVIPVDNKIGNSGQGFEIANRIFGMNRPCAAAIALGVARRALDESLNYSYKRIAFGKPIWKQQSIGHKLAEMATQIEAANHLVLKAAIAADEDSSLSHRYSSMAKYFATDIAMKICIESVQIFGGYGVLEDFTVEKLMRDIKLCQIYEGTTEIHKTIIVKDLYNMRRQAD